MRRHACHALFGIVALAAALPASAKPFEFPALRAGRVTATIPDAWTGAVQSAPMPEATTVRFTGPAPGAFVVLVTVISPPPGAPPPAPADVHADVERSATEAAPQSVEGTLTVQDFSAANVSGAYFSATDRAPPPGEFKYMAQGVATLGRLLVTFTALSHDDPAETRETALDIVKSMSVAAE